MSDLMQLFPAYGGGLCLTWRIFMPDPATPSVGCSVKLS